MSRSLLALAAIVCVYNLPRLLTGTVQLDGLDVHYSAQRYLSDELHAGRLPFWTPYIFSGFPFLADLQVGAWYPLNWPFFLIGITPRSIAGELLVSGVVACSGTYVLTRRLVPASETAAVGAAMFYGLSGWFAAHSEHVGMVASAAWLPWLLVCVLRFADAPRPRRLVELGLVGAAIALPGSFQIALYTFSFVGIWAACESIAERSWSLLRRLGLGLVAAAAWGGLLSAVMILPALELVSQSVRADLRAVDLPDIGYFHTSGLLTLVDPNYYGLLAGQYWGPGDSTQHYFYAGILLVPLVVVGAGQRRVLRTAAALGVPFVWYALGPRGGLFEVVGRLPGFRSVELPMHGWYLPALGLALLAGAGLCGVTRRFGEPWGVALIALVLVDLTIVNQLLNPLAYARPTFEALYGETLQAFDAQVAAADPPVERVYGPALAAVAYRNHALQSRVSTTYGYNPLELVNYAAYAEAADTDNPRLIEAFGANYALDQGEVRPMANALPFAYFARQVVAVPDDAAARTALADLDPATTTLVTGEVPPPTVGDPSATVTVLEVDADRLTFQYSSATASLLRVAIVVYPGWQATLDARPLTLVPVDAAFMGIELPPGSGEVSLTYSPRLFWPGALLSLLALLAAVVVYQKARGPSSA